MNIIHQIQYMENIIFIETRGLCNEFRTKQYTASKKEFSYAKCCFNWAISAFHETDIELVNIFGDGAIQKNIVTDRRDQRPK